MSETLTAIVTVLVPTIGIQIGIMFFIFRRMDRMEERLVQRMDRADEDRSQLRAEFRHDSERTRAEFRTEMQEMRSDITGLQTSIARLEGAVEVLRGLVERFVTTPR